MNRLRDLHDATLRSVTFDWMGGTALLAFKTGKAEPDLVLESRDVTDLRCPRHQPWGPSVSVNSATVTEAPGGCLLAVEMQSGDLIEISCREVVLK